MPPGAHTRLILELDLGANPIAGNVIDRLGRGHPFSGWMALTRTIELTLDAARPASPARQACSTPEKSAPGPAMPFPPPSISTDPTMDTRKKTR
jgi:hypothetical protein